MTSIERRLALLESRVRNVEARLKISEPDRPKFGSKHVGKKTKEVLIQEGFSLKNAFKPQTMTKSEQNEWNEAYKVWLNDISGFDVKQIQEIHETIEKMLHPEVRQ